MSYQDRIRGCLAEKAPLYDARHVEAYMRSEIGTLDALSPAAFEYEVRVACECINEGGLDVAESLARSFGL